MTATTQQTIATILTWIVALGAGLGLSIWYLCTMPVEEPEGPDEQVTERIPKYAEPHPKLLVVAGDYHEFELYCDEHRLNRLCDAVYVARPETVRRAPGAKFVMTGSYIRRTDLREILGELVAADCTKV